MGGRADEQYAKKNQFQDMMMGQYQNLLNQAGAGTLDMGSAGGWVGPDYSGVQGDWENLKDTGGWSDRDKAAFSAVTTAPISGFYTGMKNDLARANAATGGYAGYNSQAAKLGRDAAKQGYLTALESEGTMQKDIRDRKLQALQSLTQMAQSKAHSTPGSAGSYGATMDILGRMQGLGAGINDLPYSGMQAGSFGPAIGSITSRVDETPGWQKALQSFGGPLISAGLGAFGGGGGAPKKSVSGGAASGFGAYGGW
jgi:hypothetical protein